MTPAPRDIPGDTTHDQAVHVAGTLAERGVQRVRLRTPGGAWTWRETRLTDLPAELAAAAREADGPVLEAGRGLATTPGADVAVVEVIAGRLRWASA
jgi:hypothetical protein